MARSKPTKEEFKRFLEVFQILCGFEAQHRMMRSWGADFNADELPIPEVVTVEEWLREEAGLPPIPVIHINTETESET